jgi:uncharacterized protein with GYD domain
LRAARPVSPAPRASAEEYLGPLAALRRADVLGAMPAPEPPPAPGTAEKGKTMATYIVLASFTEQGIRTVRDTTKRADAVREAARRFGVTARDFYWTMGAHDVVVVFDAPDEASMTALSMSIAAQGNVRTQTMRAFSRDEMNAVLAKLG